MRSTYSRPTMPLPDIAGDGRAGLQVSAAPVAPAVSVRANNDNLELAQALAQFHAPLQSYLDKQQQQDIHDAKTAGAAEADKQFMADPVQALTSPAAAPEWVPPAYARDFAEGYRESVGAATGAKSAVDMLAEYQRRKTEEGFDPEAFMRQYTEHDLGGIQDPLIRSKASPHVMQAASAIRTDYAKLQADRVRETNIGNLQTQLDISIRPDVTPEVMNRVWNNEILPQFMKSGQFTRTELSEAFLNQLNVVSQKAGGMPEVFDAADMPDASGMSISRANPKLAETVTKMRLQAQVQRDSKIDTDNLEANTKVWNGLNDAIKEGRWGDITDDKLYPLVGKGNVFASTHAMQEFRNMRDKAMGDAQRLDASRAALRDGMGWALDPKDAKAAYDAEAAPYEVQLLTSLGNPQGEAQVLSAVTNILGVAQRGNLGHVSDSVKRRIDAFAVSVPKNLDGNQQPPADFVQMAKVYSAMKSINPTLADKYFDADARDLFESYVNDTTQQVNPAAAYAGAYRTISPEERKRVEQLYKADPLFEQKIAAKVAGASTSWLRNVFGFQKFGTYPTNESVMASDAQLQVRQELLKHPNMGADEAMSRVQDRIKGSYVYEPETNTVVKVPFGYANDHTRDALSDWAKAAQAEFGKDSGLSLGVDRDGMLSYQTVNPQRGPIKLPLQQVLQDYAFKTEFNANDRAALDTFRQKFKAGTLTKEDALVNQGMFDKLRTMGKLTGDDQKALDSVLSIGMQDPMTNRMRGLAGLKPYTGNVSNDYAGTSTVDTLDPAKGKPVLDSKSEVARAFLANGDMAGALTAMGEGVALTAYHDPAGGAGLNIGLGYNKNGNASTWESDFKAAGIPPEKNEAIWAGKASITREQAMRLYQVSSKRYEASAKAAYGEGWDALPANQKAVLMDLQWQTRGGIAGFPKAVAALKSGDVNTASKEILVNYTDRSGVRKADTGRNSLRQNMMAGPTRFSTLLNYIGSVPTNMVQATVPKDAS